MRRLRRTAGAGARGRSVLGCGVVPVVVTLVLVLLVGVAAGVATSSRIDAGVAPMAGKVVGGMQHSGVVLSDSVTPMPKSEGGCRASCAPVCSGTACSTSGAVTAVEPMPLAAAPVLTPPTGVAVVVHDVPLTSGRRPPVSLEELSISRT